MIGLEKIPNLRDLAGTYDRLQHAAGEVGAHEIALWSQWSRFDPRLAEILTHFVASHWKQVRIFDLRAQLITYPWPRAFGVLARSALDGRLVPKEDRSAFRKWLALVMDGVPNAPSGQPLELFYFGIRKLAGSEAERDAAEPSETFAKWGYAARDLPVHRTSRDLRRTHTTVRSDTRKGVLDRLLTTHPRLTVSEYREALGNRISTRLAEMDLRNDRRLIAVGNTRGRFYRRK